MVTIEINSFIGQLFKSEVALYLVEIFLNSFLEFFFEIILRYIELVMITFFLSILYDPLCLKFIIFTYEFIS